VAPPHDPPRGDEGLDDWFARRLESHGIDSGRRPGSSARVVAVSALAVAVVLLVWVLYSAGGSGSSSASSPTTPTIPPAGSQKAKTSSNSTGTTNAAAPVPWNQVHVTVLNGTTTPNLAASAQSTLTAAGWNIAGAGDASPEFTTTEVVYPPGKQVPAQTVAKKLGLTAVPESSISGFTSTPPLTTVAVVLGPSGLPATG
jgi:hypothetical protein